MNDELERIAEQVDLTYSLVMSQHVPGMTKQHLDEPQYLPFPAQLAKFRVCQVSDRPSVMNFTLFYGVGIQEDMLRRTTNSIT
jgi:hypothetical protein